MAGAKLSPRQRMINMMYLVLIALLALNVSKEILKSFYLMEQSFNTAYTNIESKNVATMAALNKKAEESPAKTKPYIDRAKAVQAKTSEFISFIESVKAKVESLYADGDGVARSEAGEMLAADQMEKHANYFMNLEQGKYGKEVKEKINKAREDILAYLKPKAPGLNDSTNITDDALYKAALASSQLRADDDPDSEMGWIAENLEHQPTASLMAILSRIKNDAKTLESDVLSKLAARVDATDFKFDKLTAQVLARSSSVMSGENYEADILLVASSSQSQPKIIVGGSPITVEGGVGKYSVPASGVGFKTFAGEIVIKGPDGEDQAFPFEAEYQVFKPSATIAATEMNLLYIGIDNPMAISVPGFSAADINVSAPGANLKSKGGGLYNLTVGKGTKEVTISASLKKGGKRLGSQKFRVRNLPKPTAQLGGIPNDGLPKPRAQVLAQTRVLATMGQGFAYNLQYRVTGFRLIIAYKRKPAAMATANSGALTSQMQQMIRSAAPGDRILIEGIKATEAKYGFSANLSPIVITVR